VIWASSPEESQSMSHGGIGVWSNNEVEGVHRNHGEVDESSGLWTPG